MEKNNLIEAIKKVKEVSNKRNFKQKFDLVFNLKDLNLKKPEEQIEFFMNLKHNVGKKRKACAFVGPELLDNARDTFDLVVSQDEFINYQQDKKLTKKIARTYDYFVAQANIMAKVAAAFGKVLGPKGKMPNPKAGCVVPPNANMKVLYEKLQTMVYVKAKTSLVVHCLVGSEDMKDEEIVDNIQAIYTQLVHHLPKEKNNIKSAYLKLTMGPSVQIDLFGKIVRVKERIKMDKPKDPKKENKAEEPKKQEKETKPKKEPKPDKK